MPTKEQMNGVKQLQDEAAELIMVLERAKVNPKLTRKELLQAQAAMFLAVEKARRAIQALKWA